MAEFLGPNHGHHTLMGPGATVLHAMGQIETNIPPTTQQQQQYQPSPDLFDAPLSPAATTSSPDVGNGTTLINASQATISVTTAAPMAGLGRIESSAGGPSPPQLPVSKRKTILVPTYSVNGGLDTKFDPNPRRARPEHLHNLLTPEEYSEAIQSLNDRIKKSRASSVDVALLAAGPLLVPLAVWGARHSSQVKKRKKFLQQGIEDFNERYAGRGVRMVWNKHFTAESFLSFEQVQDGEAALGYRGVPLPGSGGSTHSPLLTSDRNGESNTANDPFV